MPRLLRVVTAAAALCAVAWAQGQEPTPAQAIPAAAETPRAVGTGRYAALSNELALYSPFESPWADLRANKAFESHLFGLLRAEVRLWELQDTLAAQESPAREDAAEIARIVHEQVLTEAAEALPLLQKTSNRAFARLLVHQLEAYPYEWKEEGSEELLPSLRKLADPAADKAGTRRRARRAGRGGV